MSLNQLPDEIIRHILFCLPPLDTLHGVGLTCHHLARLSKEGLLWRFHCIQTFKYWHPSHAFRTILRLPAPQTDWKKLFVLRYHQNKQISRLLDGILKTKVGRLKRFEQITKFGYDAKDFLLENCDADDSFEDVLARRYFAHAALNAIHRHLAIEQWIHLKTVESESDTHNPLELEKSLGAFDMFVLHGQPGDMSDITRCLSALTAKFCSGHPQMREWTTRQKALALNRWIRAMNLTGLQHPEKDYRNLRNCLIGQALQHEDHESIPIISSAIYCSMAQRIGLDARCNAFPTHIHVVVSPAPGRDLDDKRVDEATQPGKRMYLDPHGNDNEVPEQKLRRLLASFGSEHSRGAMDPTPASSTVIRTANNIRHSYQTFMGQQDRETETDLTRLLHGHGPMNLNACYYACLWAMLILVPTSSPDWEEMFDKFMIEFTRYCPEDVWVVDKYVVPLYRHFATTRRRRIRPAPSDVDDAWRMVRYVQRGDNTPPPVFSRNGRGNQDVSFEVGQVFRHRRYGWVGVITGWTFMGGNMRREEDVENRRPRPPEAPYYSYMRSTTAERNVIAEDNVELINEPELVLKMPFLYAGKYFKRFDPETCRFISNLKEEYPDD